MREPVTMPAFFTPWLKRAGYLDQLWVRIGHVGSRPISEADDWGQQGWDVFAPNLEIYGFDADPDACEAANTAVAEKGIPWPEIHVPLVLSDRCDTQTLYITQDPMCSSLYPPNEPFLTRFQVEMDNDERGSYRRSRNDDPRCLLPGTEPARF